MSFENSWKTRVYILTETGDWEDCGTGLLTIKKEESKGNAMEEDEGKEEKIEPKEATFCFKVLAIGKDQTSGKIPGKILEKLVGQYKGSEPDSCILYTRLSREFIYNKQETIITWDDTEIEEEIAISFLDRKAAGEVWERICQVTERDPRVPKTMPDSALGLVPLPNEQNLSDIIREFPLHKDNFILVINQQPRFLEELRALFLRAEGAQDIELIRNIQILIKDMVMACDTALVESLLNSKYYSLTFGALEYAEANSGSHKVLYRDFLENKLRFRNVVNIKSTEILEKIHISYRLSYLLDCILASYIDEMALHNLNKIHLLFQDDIILHVIQSDEILSNLAKEFSNNLEDCLNFLEEIISMMKHFPLGEDDKIHFVQKLGEVEFLPIILERTIDEINGSNPNANQVMKLLGVVTFMLQYRLSDFQDNFLALGARFFAALIKAALFDEQGVQVQVTEVVKQIMGNTRDAKPALIDMAYDKFLGVINRDYVREPCKKNGTLAFLILQYTEILSLCCKLHGHRIRVFLIKEQILQGLVPMFELNNKQVSIAIIKLFKNMIHSKDEFLLREIISKGIFDKFFLTFRNSNNTKNMVYSCFLDLFGSIYVEKVDSLIEYMLSKKEEFLSLPVMNQLSLHKKKPESAKMSYGTHRLRMMYDEDEIDEDIEEEAEDVYEKRVLKASVYCFGGGDKKSRNCEPFTECAEGDIDMVALSKLQEGKTCNENIRVPEESGDSPMEIVGGPEKIKDDQNSEGGTASPMKIESPLQFDLKNVNKNRGAKEIRKDFEKEEEGSTKRKKLKNL